MRTYIEFSIISILLFSFLQSGCAPAPEGLLTIKDGLPLKGSCIISGKVTNADTHKPIRAANVVVFSKPISAVTDLYGQYQIVDIPPGIYTIEVFCVGYTKKVISDIESKPDRFITLDIKLEPKEVHIEK